MCGIFGLITTRRTEGFEAALDASLRALGHRGPDDSGQFLSIDGDVICGLTHTRLSIIDLSPGGHQPMSTSDGRFTLTYNGEIYNHVELRRELEALGEQFSSTSDTEVLLKAYARWGAHCVKRLRGMFAFGVYDRERRTLVLARDRLGIKPLYYMTGSSGVIFASEVRALIAAGAAERRLSPWAVESFLAFGSVAEPATILDRVRALPPGSILEYKDNSSTIRRYWELSLATDPLTFDEAVERVRPVLQDSVRLMLIADVPVGVFLSGGIDSSAIVALAAKASTAPVHTFTVTFDEAKYSEASFAAAVASHFGCDHHQVHLPAEQAARDIGAAVRALDQPSADGVNTYFVSRAAREAGLRVALSGLGADELFAGYAHFGTFKRMLVAAQIARPLSRLAGSALRASDTWGSFPTRVRKGIAGLATGGDPEAMYGVVRGMLTEEQRRALVDPAFVEEEMRAGVHLPEAFAPDLPYEPDAVNAVSALEIASYLRNTLLRDTDVMSMAHALEVRPPFLDHELVEAVLRVPGALKLQSGKSKPLLTAAVPTLPSAVMRPKMGFTLPFDAWFRGPLRPWMEDVLLGGPARRLSFLRPSAVEALWAAFLKGPSRVSHARVFCVAALALWCEANGVSA